MRRREFIALAGSVALTPVRARAQQVRRIGMLMMYAEANPVGQALAAAFRDGLAKLGWREGQNLHIEYRWATTNPDLIQRSAKELVALAPELILTSSTPTTRMLLQETRAIPIIFGNIVDPVGSGFVASLAKPGGNVTGFVNLDPSVSGKYLELLKEIAPRITSVVVFFNPTMAPYSEIYLKPYRAAAASLGLKLSEAPVLSLAELDDVMAAQAREPNGAVTLVPDGFWLANNAGVTALAGRHRLPAIYFNRAFAETGGLMSYGNDILDNLRRAASYADRILKGEKPADLPVQFPTKFEFAINLNAAKALGLDVPLFLQQQADEVIE